MNKIFKVIWNEARNAYVVVSEIAKNHGSKSCSTKKLLAMLIATGVMTCASFDVLAAEPAAKDTNKSQYVAFKDDSTSLHGGQVEKFGGYNYIYYIYDETNKYWVREGYVLTVDKNGGKYTPLSENAIRADVAYTGTSVPGGILQSVTSTVSASGTVTNMGESLNKITAGSFAGVSHAGGTEVAGSWNYIIQDSSWKGSVNAGNYKDGYVDLIDNNMPKGFITAESNKGLVWDNNKQAYTYKGKAVDYSNVYVIDGEIGVFTNKEGTKVYTGTVYGKNNEILMTVKDANNQFYSYWAAEVTDPSATMATYRVEEYNKNLAKLVENDDALNRNDIKEVTLTNYENSATIGLLRNGDKAVDGAITVTSGGGTGGSGAAHDTFVKISNGTTEQTFATGSKVEAIVDNDATTGIKINGQTYTIKSGSKVSVTQNADEKTTTITVDGTETTITDTDTTYTEGDGIAIDKTNKNAISVKLKDGENNLEVTEAGLALKEDLTVNSVKAGDTIVNTNGLTIGTGDRGIVLSTNNVSMGGQQIHNVANGIADNDAVNVSQLNKVSAAAKTEVVKGTNIASVVETTATDGHTVYTVNAKGTSVSVDGNFNLNTTTDDETNVTNYGISLKDSVTIGGTHAVTINGTDGTVTGLTNTTWNKDSITSGRAATEDQLQAVATEAGKHTTLSNGKNTTVKPVTTADGHLEYKVDVNDELKDIKSIIGAGEGAGSISFANGGIKFNNKVTIDNNGKISGVANGIADNDAVNVSQLNKVSAAAKTEVVKGTNIASVVETTATDGHTVYTVNAKGTSVSVDGNFNLNTTTDDETNVTNYGISLKDSVTIGGTHAVTINGTDGTVTGLTNTTWNKDSITSGRAATEDQLQAVATEAGKHTTLSNGKNTTVESTVKDGQTDYKVNVAGDLTDITSVANGDSKINLNKDSIIISNGNKYFAITNSGIGMSYIGADYSAKSIMLGENGTTISGGLNVAGSKITGVAAGEVSKTSTDAINGSQLNQTNENVAALDKRVTQNEADIAQNKADIAQNKADIAQNKADIAQNKADIAQNKADIAQNKADIATNKQNIDKLNTRVDGVEKLAKQHTTVTAGDNIAVIETTNKDGGKEYNVALKNIIDLGDKGSVTTGQTEMNKDGLKVGDKVSVTATAVTAGKTSISDEGVKVGDKTYINDKGLNANGQNITNVADGKVEKDSKDAINGGQLHQAKADINNRINKLGSRVNKVGAGAAALAALHPMDFDPDDKLTFSAGYGNYGGENAAAIGAYYRPDEKVMFSVAGTVGNGENMVNAGVSFALDRTNHVSNSRTALAREVIDLRGQLAVMGAKMAKMEKAFGMLDETKTKLFPDVPANHWAYEYIAKLAGNGYIEGYPDGNFGGDRLMTRYEFAAMLYRAIEKGAALEEKIIKEFEPELGRIRVDRISGEDGDRDKIERVRVNDTKGERDHYGNKLAK